MESRLKWVSIHILQLDYLFFDKLYKRSIRSMNTSLPFSSVSQKDKGLEVGLLAGVDSWHQKVHHR